MTDKQIEKALELCSNCDHYSCNDCPLKTFISELDLSCNEFLMMEVNDYIKRLKKKIEGLTKFEDDEEDFEFETATHEECVEHQKELQEMRKQTAKEILQELFDEAMQYGKSTVGIEWMAKKYGIEVEK